MALFPLPLLSSGETLQVALFLPAHSFIPVDLWKIPQGLHKCDCSQWRTAACRHTLRTHPRVSPAHCRAWLWTFPKLTLSDCEMKMVQRLSYKCSMPTAAGVAVPKQPLPRCVGGAQGPQFQYPLNPASQLIMKEITVRLCPSIC